MPTVVISRQCNGTVDNSHFLLFLLIWTLGFLYKEYTLYMPLLPSHPYTLTIRTKAEEYSLTDMSYNISQKRYTISIWN